MKNQYFGDNRDLFKYDLVYRVMEADLVNHFTFIPMLTRNEDKKHGQECNRDEAKAGTENEELMSFLDGCVKEGRRYIKQLECFFAQRAVNMTIYCGKDKYFSHERRQEYFERIGDGLLSESLVLVDPDIGLEVKRSREEHILYREVKDLYERMDRASILMIYQHFPRKPRQQYLNTRFEDLKEKITGDWPICVDDNEIIFFFLTKNKSLEESLTEVIGDYAERYSK